MQVNRVTTPSGHRVCCAHDIHAVKKPLSLGNSTNIVVRAYIL